MHLEYLKSFFPVELSNVSLVGKENFEKNFSSKHDLHLSKVGLSHLSVKVINCTRLNLTLL